MGGAYVTWRIVRGVFLVMTVAALAALAIAPAVAAPDAGAELVHRLTMVPGAGGEDGNEATLTATLGSSDDGGVTWQPAAGEQISFAYVTDGAGRVTALNGGPVGAMTCTTDRSGHCTITVRSEIPGDAVVTAAARSLSASVTAAEPSGH